MRAVEWLLFTYFSEEKKENRNPDPSSPKTASKLSPIKAAGNLLKPPHPTHNNGQSQQVLHIDVEYPTYKDKGVS